MIDQSRTPTYLYFYLVYQLPRMLETDAFARYYGLQKGQVVKFTYCSGIAEFLETYRCILWCFPVYYMLIKTVLTS